MRDVISHAIREFKRRYGAIVLHQLILLWMRLERSFGVLAHGRGRARVICTACWRFPIYSQTFVYREASELAHSGATVRFSYTELASPSELPEEFSILWRLKRRLVLTAETSARDLNHYMRRMPERVREVAGLIARAAGVEVAEVFEDEHFRHAMSFTRMAECWGANYLHSYFFYERTLFCLVASHLLGIPRGVSCYADHMLDDYRLKLIPTHMDGCAVVVATSKRIKEELEGLAKRPLPNVVVKPNAVDTRQFPERGRHAGDLSAGCTVVTVSRIHPKKGLTHLMEAAAILREHGVRATFHVLGDADGHDRESVAYHEELKRRLAASDLNEVFRLEGRKTSAEVREFLLRADIFAAPFVELPNGDKDGIPTALLEAMSAGCAIVTTDAGSIAEVIEPEVEGLVAPQADGRALADAIERLIRDPELRTALSRAALARVRREFDILECEARFHQRMLAAVSGSGGQGAPQRQGVAEGRAR